MGMQQSLKQQQERNHGNLLSLCCVGAVSSVPLSLILRHGVSWANENNNHNVDLLMPSTAISLASNISCAWYRIVFI
ncbi:hypothetical protein XENTR_v10009165 [Xenopus tropicalis]|nr:hypothetical protein XENTR_v10009165 [Xenopus tropicalis]